MPAPKPPLSVTGTGELYAVKRTIHLLIKPDNLTCYQQRKKLGKFQCGNILELRDVRSSLEAGQFYAEMRV